jgi:hypothetical protein
MARSWPKVLEIVAMLALLASALAFGAAHAAPACVADALPDARLSGTGKFTYFGLDIYEAQLWVGKEGYRASGPFALELRYARKLYGKKIAEASAEQMEKTGAGTDAKRQQWLREMLALFPDVQDGSRICGVAQADGVTRFYFDGKPLGAVSDPEFTRAFFGIWLSPATTARSLRESLLKDAAPR